MRLPKTLETWLPFVAFAAYLAIVVVLVFHHEPWRDEADTWLAARDLSPAGLFRFANYVGSPTLWYFLQMPLAKLGAPYMSLGLLNAACAALGVALFLWRAPFAMPLRLLFAFSFFASYEYGVIARSYALSMTLVWALAALHARRFARPLLFGVLVLLLANTNLHGLILATFVFLAQAWDSVKRGAREPRAWAGLLVGLAGIGLALVQLVPPPDGQLPGLRATIDPSLITQTLAGALFPTADDFMPAQVAAWILFAGVCLSLARAPRALFVVIGSSALLWALFVLKYPGQVRHWGFLLLAMLYGTWIARVEESGRAAETVAAGGTEDAVDPKRSATFVGRAARTGRTIVAVGLPIAFAWSVYIAVDFWQRDYRDPFSASKAMARFLVDQRLAGIPIAAWPSAHCESLLPYLPGVRFYDPGTRRYGTCMKWDRACAAGWTIPEDSVVARVDAAFPPGSEVLLLANRPMRAAERSGFQRVHAEIGNVIAADEQYFLYRR